MAADTNHSDALASLRARLADRSAVIGVIGLGYVGLPLALRFSQIGHPIVGDSAYAGDWESYRLFLHAASIALAPLPPPTGAIDVTVPCADLDEAIS